jgi:hypothetical protein
MAKLSFGQPTKSSPKPLTRRDVRIVLAGAGETSDTTGETSEFTAQTTEIDLRIHSKELKEQKERRIL